MNSKFEIRRRKSGFRNIAPRRSLEQVDLWRSNQNLAPLSPDAIWDDRYNNPAGIVVEDLSTDNGQPVVLERTLAPSTWNENRKHNFKQRVSGDPENGTESGETNFGWVGGWSMPALNGDTNPANIRPAEGARLVRDNRRIVFPDSPASLRPDSITNPESFSDFAQREFFFPHEVPIAQDPKSGTSFVWSAQAKTELDIRTKGIWVEEGIEISAPQNALQGPYKAVDHFSLMDALEGVRNTLQGHQARGDTPNVDERKDKSVPWSEREFMSPYGFYDEELLDHPAGIQLVGSDGEGLEAFGFVGPSIAHNHRVLNSDDDAYDTQVRVRAKRGSGGDYWDWLPKSAKHVWFMRHPYVGFENFEALPAAQQVFEDYRDIGERSLGNLRSDFLSFLLQALESPDETLRKVFSSLPFERLATYKGPSDSWRAKRRAPTEIFDQADDRLGGGGLTFEREPIWTAPIEAGFVVDKSIPTSVPTGQARFDFMNKRSSSILHTGGLFMGSVGLDSFDDEDEKFNKFYAFGDNFVMDERKFFALKETLRQDEWMIEAGVSFPLGTPESIEHFIFWVGLTFIEGLLDTSYVYELSNSEKNDVLREAILAVDWASEITGEYFASVAESVGVPTGEFDETGFNDVLALLISAETVVLIDGHLPFAAGSERTILSTASFGGLEASPGNVAGEVRPESGFAVSVAIKPVFVWDVLLDIDNTDSGVAEAIGLPAISSGVATMSKFDSSSETPLLQAFDVQSRLYLTDGSKTEVAKWTSRIMDVEMAEGNLPFRVVAWKKGSKYGTSLQAYGTQEVSPQPPTGLIMFPFTGPNVPDASGMSDSIVLYETRFADIEWPNFEIGDPLLVIPSQRTTRSIEEDETNPWVRPDGSSRLFTASEFRQLAFGNSMRTSCGASGYLLGGLAIHDSIITNINNLNDLARRNYGLDWSAWLACSERCSYVDEGFIKRSELDDYSGLTKTSATRISSIAALQEMAEVNLPSAIGGDISFRSERGELLLFPKKRNFRMSEGVCLAQWRGFANWNETSGQFDNISDGRPFGLTTTSLLETSKALERNFGSGLHLKADDKSETQNHPRWTSWGLRFERDAPGEMRDSYLESEYEPSEWILRRGSTSSFEHRKNFNVCAWVTLNKTLLDGFGRQRIWEDTNIGRLDYELFEDTSTTSSTKKTRLVATLYGADVSNSGDPDDVEVFWEMPAERLYGVPLHVCFGQVDVDFKASVENSSLDPESEVEGNKLSFIFVDSPDEPETFYHNTPFYANQFNFAIKHSNSSLSTETVGPGKIKMGGTPDGHIPCDGDFILGGIEIRKWLFDEILAFSDRFQSVSAGAVLILEPQVGDPFFDSVDISTNSFAVLVNRFPLLREYAHSRAMSLWGYTGRARVLPDNYAITSIDGVGTDTFENKRWNMQGILPTKKAGSGAGDPIAEFNTTMHPNMFWSDKTFAYSDKRVASYELVKSQDRPQLFEVIDPQAQRQGLENLANAPNLYGGLTTTQQDEILSRNRKLENAQVLRRFWYTRGLSPLNFVPNKWIQTFGSISDFHNIFTPALKIISGGVEEFEDFEEEQSLIAPSLKVAIDRTWSDVDGLGTQVNSTRPCSTENSFVYPNGLKYGTLELERIRCEWEPTLFYDAGNLDLKQTPTYRDSGGLIDGTTSSPEVIDAEVIRTGHFSGGSPLQTLEGGGTGNRSHRNFPTLSLVLRYGLADVISGTFNENPVVEHESAVLGNLCLERGTTVWGFAETNDDVILDENGDPEPGLPTKFRIDTDDLDLTRAGNERVWRKLQGGRQLLRRVRSGDGLSEISFTGEVPSLGDPISSSEAVSRAFLGKGRGGWARATWSTSTEELQPFRVYEDTTVPDPLEVYLAGSAKELVVERADKYPTITAPARTKQAWKQKSMQRAIREDISGSPSPIFAGADGLSHVPSIEASRVSSSLLGFPVWTPYARMLHSEWAKTLRTAVFPSGSLNAELLDRASSLWIELTGNQMFPAWLEWARPEGGWQSRGAQLALAPFLNFLAAPVFGEGELGRQRITHDLEGEVLALAGPRSQVDPSRLFERALFESESLGEQTSLLFVDRLVTFDDEFPVASTHYNARWVRNIPGRLDMTPQYGFFATGRFDNVMPNTLEKNLVIENLTSETALNSLQGAQLALAPALNPLQVENHIYPMALNNMLNRYSSSAKDGYLRHSLRSQRVTNAFLKMWYGTGDSLVRSDYVKWHRGLHDFLVFDEKSTGQSVLEGSPENIVDALLEYNTEVIEGGEFEPPSTGGEYSVWQTPRTTTGFLTSLRPYGPDARVNNYQNKQMWTRDIKLQDERRVNDLWSIRHSAPHEMMSDVTVKPRGWRYGIMEVRASGGKWAINPRRWGHPVDITRSVPAGKTRADANGVVRVRFRQDENGQDMTNTSWNKDGNFRSFTPFVSTDNLNLDEEGRRDFVDTLRTKAVVRTDAEVLRSIQVLCERGKAELESFELDTSDPAEMRDAIETLLVELERHNFKGVRALDTLERYISNLRERSVPLFVGEASSVLYQPPTTNEIVRVKIMIDAIKVEIDEAVGRLGDSFVPNVRPANPRLPLPISMPEVLSSLS